MKTSLYLKNYSTAIKEAKVEEYKQSQRENACCKEQIEKSLAENYNVNTWSINVKKAAKEAISACGLERVSYICAITIRLQKEDGRFSADNVKWACNQTYYPDFLHDDNCDNNKQFILSSHPGLVNLLTNEIRDIILKTKLPLKSEYIDELKAKYSTGTVIKLNLMSGETQLQEGITGTVIKVDDAGNIHMHWENGSSLALIEALDDFEIMDNDTSCDDSIHKLYDKIKAEYQEYENALFNMTPAEIINHSDETSTKYDILTIITGGHILTYEAVEKLLALDKPLDWLYHEWIDNDIEKKADIYKESICMSLEIS